MSGARLRTWTFNLRDNVFFHDGTKFDSQAVKFVVERNKRLNGGASYIWSYVEKIIINNPYQITFILTTPVSYYRLLLAHAWMEGSSAAEIFLKKLEYDLWNRDRFSGFREN